jgi:hypothetical protein
MSRSAREGKNPNTSERSKMAVTTGFVSKINGNLMGIIYGNSLSNWYLDVFNGDIMGL